jgi:lipopolysaccharide/colanic/teichoic acid biosynthesis glycosyltransferase
LTRKPDSLGSLSSCDRPLDLTSDAAAVESREAIARQAADVSANGDHRGARRGANRRVESFAHRTLKRWLDIAVASLLGVASLPLVGLLAAYIAVDSGRPVFFWQDRVGRFGRRFRLLKIRTLPRDVLEWPEETWYVQPDSRLMAVVRRTGIDELPQLWNVIRGEMSLVGPRPERPVFVEGFQARLPLYSLRHQLRPGLTGWAQVHGWRGDTSIGRRLEYDLDYLENWSLGLDLRILARTVVMVVQELVRGRGATAK